ncbi:MAG: cob(I)yrinic acid a,c-diamide adenosyltransferase [Bacteroidales bacterium]
MRGYIQIYTGDGKGKTTAALGLAVRATGAGKRVYFAQFVKSQKYSEVKCLQEQMPSVEIKQYGQSCFIDRKPTSADVDAAKGGLEEVWSIVLAGKHELVVLDEVNIAIYFKLLSAEEVLDVLQHKPEHVEVVLTGRYAPAELVEYADLVTEMKEVKHYYNEGVKARKGIEC